MQVRSFDSLASFRHHPWLYGLLGVISTCLTFLLIWVSFFFRTERLTPLPQPTYLAIETPAERDDRLMLMNILNTFNIEETRVPITTANAERIKSRRQHIEEVLSRLGSLNAGGQPGRAQSDLLDVFKSWDTALDTKSSLKSVREHFITVGKAYPWLNTLVWLIVLNHL